MAGGQPGRTRKKFIAWVRWQFGADEGQGSPTYCRDWCGRRFGSPTTKCSECTEPPLWSENADAAELFNTCWPQRLTDREGAFIGFDYPAMCAVMQMLQIDDPDTFRKVREAEMAMIKHFNKQAKSQ